MSEVQTQRREWTTEQRRVVETWGVGCAVAAGAGSGKTSTLVEKCEELLRQNPEARFVAVSFTEKSASELRARLAAKVALERHWVMTIHGLCSAILREEPRSAGLVGEERVLSESESQALWGRALERLWSDALPTQIARDLDCLLERHTRAQLVDLLVRGRALRSFGVLQSLSSSESVFSKALHRILEFVLKAYERGKARRAALDFDDLEHYALEALQSERVRQEFHRRFDLVMVDEFQDTNPVQAQVIWSFARPDQSNLCVVGDPKQSIYRFRDADVSLFTELCERLPVRLSLTRNFRSRPGILEYSNTVCARVFPSSGLQYEALIAERPASGEDEVLELHLERAESLAEWLWSEVSQGKRLSDFVILVRKLRGATHWLEALERAQVPVAIASGGFFWEDPRVREVYALLKAWRQPANSLSAAVFLRAPWVGVPDLTLDLWVREQKKPLLDHFFETEHPLALRLLPLRHRVVRPGEIIAALLDAPESESQLGYAALGLWHRSETLSFEGRDFAGVVRELGRSIEAERREREVPPPRNLESLRVMTIHGSKGLEFPHVILLDFASDFTTPPRARSPTLFWDREKGAFLAPRDEEGELDRKNSEYLQWKELERSKELAENKRLFYVALTRAQERLVTVFFPHTPPESDPKEPFDLREDWRAWIQTSAPTRTVIRKPQCAEAFQWGTQASSGEIKKRPQAQHSGLRRSRISVSEWNLHQHCPRAYEWTYLRAPDPATLNRERREHERAKKNNESIAQNEIGTRVHAALERLDAEMLRALEAEFGSDRFRAAPLIEWMERSPWMRPSDVAKSFEAWAELAFEAPVETRDGKEVLVGALDRLVCERGQYVVLDFKITRGEKSEEALIREYQAQLELYAYALGALEPEAQCKVRAVLIHVSPFGVREIEVPLRGVDLCLSFEQMSKIVQGAPGVARPSERCRFCDFTEHCAEGRSSLG